MVPFTPLEISTDFVASTSAIPTPTPASPAFPVHLERYPRASSPSTYPSTLSHSRANQIAPLAPMNAVASSSSVKLDASPCPTPARQLRSCLSPSRRSSGCPTPERPASSRATSFSSDASCEVGWRRTKSVRWEGEEQGCAVTSYHDTWSRTEYDRTPLDPPSEAERNCVLPERGSRSLRPIDCFTTNILDDLCESPIDESDSSRDMIITPLTGSEDVSFEESSSTDVSADEAEDGADVDEEEKEWEACMERRRMMFAMRSHQHHESGADRQPEFEGYRSISATLAGLLASVQCAGSRDEMEQEDVIEPSPHLLSEENVGAVPRPILPEVNGSSSKVLDGDHPMSDQVSPPISTPMAGYMPLTATMTPTPIATPSLLSSTGSEADSVIASSPAMDSSSIMMMTMSSMSPMPDMLSMPVQSPPPIDPQAQMSLAVQHKDFRGEHKMMVDQPHGDGHDDEIIMAGAADDKARVMVVGRGGATRMEE